MQNLKRKEKIVIGISIVLLILIYLRNIEELTNIIVTNDEFGYWGIAAQFAGKDWSSLLETTPYYAYGYSLLLVPLFWLNVSSEVMYQLAIIMNVCFIIGSYFLCVSCGKKLFPEINRGIILAVSFTVTVYTNTVVQAEIAWSETLLYFLYWLVFWTVINLYEKATFGKSVIFVFANVYLYMVHQRSIGVIVSSVIIVFLFAVFRRIERNNIFLMLALCAICLIVHKLLKSYAVNNIFTGDGMVSMNDYSGQMGKLAYSFGSFSGFVDLLESICGKLYYLGAATLLIGFYAAWMSIKIIINLVKELLAKRTLENVSLNSCIGIFLFLSFGASFLIDVIAMNNAQGRLDALIYGRYMEYAIGPILLFGIGYIIKCGWSYINIIISGLILFALSFVVNSVLANVPSTDFNGYCATALNVFFLNRSQIQYLIYYVTVVIVSAVTVAILPGKLYFLRRFKNISALFFCVVVTSTWLAFVSGTPVSMAHESIDGLISPINTIIQTVNYNADILYLTDTMEDDMSTRSLKYLQFALQTDSIVVIDKLEDLGNFNDAYVLIDSDYPNKWKLEEMYTQVCSTDALQLYIKNGSDLEIAYQEYADNVEYSVFDNIKKDEKMSNAGYLYYGPYIELCRADYEVSYKLRIKKGTGKLGYCDISVNNGEKVLTEVSITDEMFQDDIAIITIPVSLYKTESNVEFRVYMNEGCDVELEDIYYKKRQKSYTPGLSDSQEFQEIANAISLREDLPTVVYMNSTEDQINLDYLEKLFFGKTVLSMNPEEISTFSADQYIIADKEYLDWMNLLPQYRIIEEFENHLLLVHEEHTLENENLMSIGKYADISVIQKMDEGIYQSGVYTLNEGGEFEVILDLDQQENIQGDLHVEVLSGQTIHEKIDNIKYQDSIKFMFDSYTPISNLSFRIYSENDKKEISYKSGKIARLRDQNSYIYDEQLGLLIDEAKRLSAYDGRIRLLAREWRQDARKEISQYLGSDAGIFIEYVEPEEIETFENNLSNIETISYPDFPWFITTTDTRMIYEFLTDYTILDRTDWYVLMVRTEYVENLKKEGYSVLSEGLEILPNFFKDVDKDGITNWNISIPGGTYRLNFEVGSNTDYDLPANEIQIRAWNGNSLYKTYLLSEGEDSLIISSQNGFSNLRYEVFESIPGAARVEIAGIEKVSDDFEIQMSQMQSYSGEYNEESDSIITSSDTIYGPYTSLKAGEYDIKFEYETEFPEKITFDVAANGGVILEDSSETSAEKSEKGYQIILSIFTEEDLEQVEFRTYIPEGIECELRRITVIPKE